MVLLLSILCGESRLLVSWCVGDRCNMAGSDENLDRSRGPSVEDQGWSRIGRVLGGQTIGRSGDAVCGLHRAQRDEEHVFLGLTSKPRSTVFRFGPQNRQLWFGNLGLKITVTISWFVPQNQAGDGLSVAPQNRREEDGTGHALRTSGLLRLEVSRARVFQFSSKLVKERQWVVHMASSEVTWK
jgi:hypothetical protein